MANTAPGNTGNALTDASTGLAVDPQAAATAINTANQQAAQVASDCLWPPSGQFTVPIIPGLLHQSVSLPCLFTYSEGRAVVGASLVAAGLGVIFFVGVPLLVVAAAVPFVSRYAGPVTGFLVGRKTAPKDSPIDSTPLAKPQTMMGAPANPDASYDVTSGGG